MSVADNIGLIANCSLWDFGNPYKCANLEPEGLAQSAMVFGRILRTMESRILSFCSRGSAPGLGFLQGNGTELACIID